MYLEKNSTHYKLINWLDDVVVATHSGCDGNNAVISVDRDKAVCTMCMQVFNWSD